MIQCFICIIAFLVQSSLSINIVYLTKSCNQTTAVTTGIALQSSTSLLYPNSMRCYHVVTVPTGSKVVAVFRLFELEGKSNNGNGACFDYVNFYDGDVTSGSHAKINSDPFCGSTIPTNITSVNTVLSIEMITDSTSMYRGFDLLLSAYTDAPCSSGQFVCSNGKCIASVLECDDYNQCGDDSDEATCSAADLAAKQENDNSALIAGLAIGLGSFVVIAVLIGLYLYRQYRWKLFLRDPLTVIQQWDNQNTYPLTKKYYKSYDGGYRPMKNESTDGTDRPSTPNSGNSSKGILKLPQPTHSFA